MHSLGASEGVWLNDTQVLNSREHPLSCPRPLALQIQGQCGNILPSARLPMELVLADMLNQHPERLS